MEVDVDTVVNPLGEILTSFSQGFPTLVVAATPEDLESTSRKLYNWLPHEGLRLSFRKIVRNGVPIKFICLNEYDRTDSRWVDYKVVLTEEATDTEVQLAMLESVNVDVTEDESGTHGTCIES